MSDRAAQWFAPQTNIEVPVGVAYEGYFQPGNKTEMNTRGCKVIMAAPFKELIFEWKGPDQFSTLMN
ncbi:hypothetical protein [Mesobacillus jeotgali]|uniref:hypothetical protein n=1 Tax=Mesobacillus jeotgali TaxID=129985 RepID=UPI0021474A06|nr:hypothetical protein [Mesobacillus jeotgali]